MIDLPFRADRGSRVPVYRQLAECLRGLIEAGRLGGGQKLPASRELAAGLGLSRTTVTQAYDDLVAGGLLDAHVGQGTFVAMHVAAYAPRPAPGRAFVWPGLFAARTRALAIPAGLIGPPDPAYDFRGGRVDEASLPAAALRRALADSIGGRLADMAGEGIERLAVIVRRHLASSRDGLRRAARTERGTPRRRAGAGARRV
jgi:GntR family transcriptional regulator / MocR family aminotransferase